MARPLRIEYEGAVYHITSRGNRTIKEAVERYGYTQKEVADFIGIRYSVISILLKR